MSYDSYTRKKILLALCFIVPLLLIFGMSSIGKRIASGAFNSYFTSWSGFRTGMTRLGKSVFSKGEKEKMEQLENQLYELQIRAAVFERIEEENRQLRTVLGLNIPQKWHCTHAPLTMRDPAVWNREFWIGKGSEDRIKPGNPVLLDGFLIGRISEVMNETAKVCTIASPECRFSAFVQGKNGTSYPCIFSGADKASPVSAPLCFADYMDKNAIIGEGDFVITSGLGTQIPYGIPVGTLIQDANGKCPALIDNARASSFVKPLADFSNFSFVTVYHQ